MKVSRFDKNYKNNASSLHKKIGECLRSKNSLFYYNKVFQEYPVDKINPNFKNSRCKFDWVILDLKLVIEGHGAQHYQATSFGNGKSIETKLENFADLKYRDQKKEQAALDAGFTYIIIKYSEIKDITDKLIWDRYKENLNTIIVEKKIDNKLNEYKINQQEKLKAYNKLKYKKQKEYLKHRERDLKDEP